MSQDNKDAVKEASLEKKQGIHKPLNCCVKDLMKSYFSDLNGHRPSDLYRAVIDEVERPLLEVVLSECGDNRTEASQMLGINRGTLLKKLKYHQLT